MDLREFEQPYGLDDTVDFGEHKGKTVRDILFDDPGWLEWAWETVEGFEINAEVEEELMEAMDHEIPL